MLKMMGEVVMCKGKDKGLVVHACITSIKMYLWAKWKSKTCCFVTNKITFSGNMKKLQLKNLISAQLEIKVNSSRWRLKLYQTTNGGAGGEFQGLFSCFFVINDQSLYLNKKNELQKGE